MRIKHDARHPRWRPSRRNSHPENPGDHRQGKRHRHPFIEVEVGSEGGHDTVVHEALNNPQLPMQRAIPLHSLSVVRGGDERVDVEQLMAYVYGVKSVGDAGAWDNRREECKNAGCIGSGAGEAGRPCDVIDKQQCVAAAWKLPFLQHHQFFRLAPSRLDLINATAMFDLPTAKR